VLVDLAAVESVWLSVGDMLRHGCELAIVH
jgi:hypothetical protein